MDCNTRENTKKLLEKKGVINDNLHILNEPELVRLMSKYKDLALSKYGINWPRPIYTIQEKLLPREFNYPTKLIKRLFFDGEFFNVVNKAVDDYNIAEEIEKEKEREYRESKKEEWEENREYLENNEPFTKASDANTQDSFFQIKNIFNSLLEVETSLKSQNKTAKSIGSDKNIDKILKKAGLDVERRQQFLQLLKDNPSLKSLKLSEVLSSYLKEFVKESDRQYYKAIDEPLSKELENILIDYFDKFHIRKKELDNLKEKFGVDSVGVFDVLAKTIYYAKNRNILTLPEEYGHVFVELLGSISNKKANNPLFKYMFNNIDKWDGYQRVLNDYKNVYVTAEGNIDIYKIKKEAIGQAIGIALVRNYKNNKAANKNLWDKIFNKDSDFWTKVQEIIDYLYSILGDMDYVNINLEADKIAKDILSKNYSKLDRLKKDTSNYNLLSYSETIKNQNKIDGGKALKFMQWFSEKGMIITGSLAYRLQGTVFRPELDALHDIDNIVPYDVHGVKLELENFLTPEQLEQNKLYRKLIAEGKYKEAKQYKIKGNIRLNIEEQVEKIQVLQDLKKEFPETEFLYSFYNQKANAYYVTINAIWSENQELKDRFKSYTGSFNERLENFTKEELEQIYLFDFFLRPEVTEDYKKIEDKEFGLSLAHFNYSFYEKLNMMGRPKDAYDYQMWDYFDEDNILPPEFNDRMVYYQMNNKKDKVNKNIKVYQGITNSADNREFNYLTTNRNEALDYGSNVREIELNPSNFLVKREKNGEWSKSFEKLHKEFKNLGNETFDILDNSKEGLKNQNKFFSFLKEKGYEGYAEKPSVLRGEVTGENDYLITFTTPKELPTKLNSITPKVNIVNYRTMDDKSKEDAMNGVEEAQKRWVEEEIAEFYEAVEQYTKGLDTFSSKGVNKGKATIDDVIDETLGIFRTIQMFPKFSDSILPYLNDIKTALNTFGRKEGYAIYKAKKDAKGQAKEMTYENLFEVVDKFIKPNTEVKPGVEELFDSNPELANAVYEALGFDNLTSKVTLSKKFADTYNIVYNGKTIGTIDIPSDLEGNTISIGDVNIKPEFRGKGLGVETYKAAMKIAGKPLESFMATDEANRVWNSLIKQGLAKKTDTGFLTISAQITPQQKQQAQQQYSQYLEQNPNGSVEQFKSWVDEFNRDNQKLNSNIQIFSDNKKGDFDSSSLKDDDLALMLFNKASGANVKSINEITFDNVQYDTTKKDFAFFGGFSRDRSPSLSEVLNQTGMYPEHIMFIGESKVYPNFYEILEKQNGVIENSVKENFDKIFSFGFTSSVFDQIKKELNNSKSETFVFETADGKTFKFPKRFVKGFYKLTSKISQISEENRQNVLDAKVKQIIKEKRESNEKGIKPVIVKEFYNDGSTDILKYAIELIDNSIIKDAVKNAKNIKVVVFSNKEFSEEGVAAWYQPNTNSIYIYEENLRIDKGAFQLLAHELIHGVTHLAINYDTSFKNEIKKLIKEVENKTGKKYKKGNEDSIYGLKDEHEFLSEAFSNPLFKQLLESIEEEKETSLSLWQKFINAIFNLFNKDSKYKTETYKISTLNKLNSIIQTNNFKFYNVSNINDNTRLANFISQKSQERLNQIQEIFNQNPELSKIGTLEQYAIYLDSIFPDSKVKDIVYHGSKDNTTNFNKNEEGIFFTLDNEYAKQYGLVKGNYYDVNDSSTYTHNVIAAIINIKNPEYSQKSISTRKGHSDYFNPKNRNNNVDGVIGKDAYAETRGNSAVVFEPEQIHILGTKQDIEGFKEFVGESTQTVESYRAQEQAELSQRIPNIENYKIDGKVVKSLITDENDLKTYNEIYDKYDALITPLLEASEESEEQVENTDSLEELLDNEKLDFQDAILIDLINKVAPNQESLPTTEEVVEELPSQQSIDSQKQNNSYSDLVSTIKGLMNTLGIKIVKAEAIYLKQQEINTLYDKLASSKSDTEKQSIQKQIDELKREGVRKNVLGLADTLNGVINLALSENNIDESEFALNEEMLHFIVDIIEQKYPDLYKELLQKVGTYNLYNQMYGVYASQKEYQNKDGSVNVNKIKKEAVAKVLNDFLSNPEYSEEDYQLSKTQNLWNKIKDTLKSFFEQKANNVAANNFRFTLDKLLNDPNFITKEDAKLLSGEEFFGIMGTISSWAGNKMIGKESAFAIKNDVSFGEFAKNMLEQKKNVSKTYIDKNTGKITSPTELNSIERYVVKTLEGMVIVRSRVSDFVTKFLDKIFPNSSSKNNKELELAAERGVIIHNIFELIFAKYVDPDTGIVRKQPINSSPQLETYEKKYAKDGELSMPEKIDKYVKELIALYPNSYFLTEIPIFNKSLTVGGTIDLMIVEPNKKVHIYDWKTKKADVHKGEGIIQKREKIDPWNIKAWRIQLDSYMDILKNNYGVESFGKVRMIPIMTEFETNGTTISNINIGSESNPDIRQRQLLAVPSKQELTGLSETDKLIKANYGLAEKLQNKANKVSDISEKERLRLQASVLEDLAIDLQVGKGIQSLVNKLEQILKIHDDIIEKDRNGEIKGSDLPIIASAIVDLSIYASDSRLINVSEELFSRFSNLTDLQKETKKELENISIKVSSKIEELKKVLINSAEIFGNDQGIYDINKIENEIENSPGILGFSNILAQKNSIYQLNFKTGQLFSNLVRGVQNQIERERSDVRRTLEKIKTDYLKDFGGIFKSDESVFSILFRYPTEQEIKEGAVDGPKLVAKIDKKFYTTLKEQKEKFVNLVNASIKLKKDFTKTAGYTELVKWLEDNIDFEAWRKNYIERKEKQKNLLETQYSYIIDEYERNYTIEQALNSWEYRYNILKSPAALNSNNISAFINENKWLSADYKKIKSFPSALAAYNAFREIMFNARRVGYIQDLSQISEIPTNITTKNKLAYYYSLVKLHGSLKYLYFNSIPEVLNNMLLKPLENNLALDDIKNGFNNINPVTQEEELELPIYMLRDFNAQVGKDGRLKSLKDLDLFKVYEELAFHVINFQNLSATEELADALIMVEQGKTLEKQMNAQGNTNEKNIKNKETKTREDILKHAKNFIYYNKTKEKDKTTVFNFSRNKLIEYWKAFTASLYLGFNHALAFKAFNASTLSTISNAGYTYSKRDVLFSPLRRALTSSLIEKSFNYHVSSSNLHENRLKNNNYAKRAAVFGKEYLLNSLTVVDYEVQKNIFYAILPNFTIIEENGVKKIVNIDKYVDDKYPDIFKETPEKRKEIFKKKNEEKEKLRKNNLSIQLEEKAKKEAKEGYISLDLSDIDAKSIDSFTNKIQEESKRILGNMSDKDIYLWKTGNLMSLITQFKGFAFKIVDVRYGGIKYNSALERWTYGKYRALGNFLSSNQQIIDENNQEVLKTKLAIGSSIIRFLTIAAPFLNIKENEQIIQVLKIKYLQYATDAKNKNETVMSEKEYIDMYLTELTSAKNELYVLSVFIGLLAFGGGDDDKDDPFWLKYIKNIIKGSQKELLFTASPKQLSSMVVMGFPGLGSLTAVFNAISFQFGNVLEFNDDWTNLFVKVDPFKYTVGERLSPIIKATPFVRPTSALLAQYSADWRKFLDVDKKSRSLVKNRIK